MVVRQRDPRSLRRLMGRFTFGLVLALAAPVLTPAHLAHADDEVNEDDIDRAKQFFRSGQQLYKQGRYEQAIVAWQEAYKLSKMPDLLFNIAKAAEEMDDYDLALEMLDAYRVHARAGEKDMISRRIRELEAKREAAEAAPEPAPEPAPVAQAPTAPVATPPPAVQSLLSVGSNPPKKRAPVGPILVGVGAAGLGAGGAFLGLGNQIKSDLQDSTTFVNEQYWPNSGQSADVGALKTYNTMFYVSTAVGAASLVTGGIIWAMQAKSKKRNNLRNVALAPSVTPWGELGFNAAGRF